MTIRIFKLSKWELLAPGEDLHLLLDNAGRKVVIEFNAEAATRVGWVAQGSQKDVLLGIFAGREDVEFRPNGPGVVTVQSDGEVWFYTNDGDTHVAGDGAEQQPYTKLLEPRDRSETLERIIEMQNATHNRLMAAQAEERAAWQAHLADVLAQQEVEGGQDTGGVVAEPEPEANGGAGGDSVSGEAGEGGGVPAA